MTGEVILGLVNGILAFAGLALWRTIRYLGGRVTELEAAKKSAEADYSRARSAAATNTALLKELRSDVNSCVGGGCEHRTGCPVVGDYEHRAARADGV